MKKKTKRAKPKPLTEMNAQELQEATSEFDEEFVADRFGPPPPEARARWSKARRKLAGRPPVGKGAKVISVSVERELLELSDQLARKQGVTRANLIAKGLRALLAAHGYAVRSMKNDADGAGR